MVGPDKRTYRTSKVLVRNLSGYPTYRELGIRFGIDYLTFLAWISCPS
jgi:hypothetical protein